MRVGRLGEEEYGTPFEVVARGPNHKLRRYAQPEGVPAVLLVPPLMVTAEVYDVAPDVSAVTSLVNSGVGVYVVDFGSPEREQGGMRRTLDDHVRAVVASITRVRELSGRDVHIAGYSQGGMFAYQAAAYLRTEGVGSVITFGSPVDVHKNLPAVRGEVAGALAAFVEPAVNGLMKRLEGLPGALTSTAFKLVSTRKEIQQRIEFVRMLHDRSALVRREARRRFLGGEGFVAWPGPAFRDFAHDFVVHNRLLSGGFVIDGKTVTLADITCPILCFVGASDEIASPASVRAITRAAPLADVSFVDVPAGHFGLVVGSRAMKLTWPTVAGWMQYMAGRGGKPDALTTAAAVDYDQDNDAETKLDLDLFLGSARTAAKDTWRRVGDMAASATDALDAIRYQEPRLRRLSQIGPGTPISPARALAQQAAKTPDQTFFLWHGRAFSYADADKRVTNVARGLWQCGIRPGDHVLVVMSSRPSLLSMTTALNRIGAVALVAPPDARDDVLAKVIADGVKAVASDPDHGARLSKLSDRPVLVLGGGGQTRALAPGLTDMEAIDPDKVDLPATVTESAGRARDLAMILLRPGEHGELRSAPVTNHRWALSAFGAAAACTLKPGDTVYSCIPLHHPTALLACVGAAIAAGTRLALASAFDPKTFLSEARRAGATVVFYAGEMLRLLVATETVRSDRDHPIRLFAGSGMRASLAEQLRERFGVGVIEFYASTTQKVVLANVAGDKVGALGRPLPCSVDVAVAKVDFVLRTPVRDAAGDLELAQVDEPGLLAARDETNTWVTTGDVVRCDADGDYWFVDALANMRDGVSMRAIEDVLYGISPITLAATFVENGAIVACYSASEPLSAKQLDEAFAAVSPAERPKHVLELPKIPLTEGFRARRDLLAAAAHDAVARFDLVAGRYVAYVR